MLLRGLLFHLFFLAVWGASPVPNDCLGCICHVESYGCTMPDPLCKEDGDSHACGPFQIHRDYWTDARRGGAYLMGSWEACTADWGCSLDAVQAYMTRYATVRRLGHTPGCEDFARLHNGGPNGPWNTGPSTATKTTTDSHWFLVQNCLNQRLWVNAIQW